MNAKPSRISDDDDKIARKVTSEHSPLGTSKFP
jgi:hypothetical protein